MARNGRSTWLWALALILVAALLAWPTGSTGQAAEPPFTDLFPPAFVEPGAIVSDPAGNLWFAEQFAGRIGRLTASGEITHFNLPEPTDSIERLVIGPDGNLWFVARRFLGPGDDYIGQLTPNGQFATYLIPGASGALIDLTVGANASLWVLASGGEVYQVALDGSSTFKYRVPRPALSLTVGPDGNFWIGATGRIMRLTPGGAVTEFPLSDARWEIPTLITGPDNALWFVPASILQNLPTVGRIATDGTISVFPLSVPGLDMVGDIATSPDGKLRVTLVGTNLLGTLSPDGTLSTTELPPSLRATDEELADIGLQLFGSTERLARNADGSFWFTRGWRQPAQIGRIAPDGTIAAYPQIPGFTPLALTIGPDQAIWFTEGADWFYTGATRIGRYTPGGSAAIVHDSSLDPPPIEYRALVTGPDGNLWATAATLTESFTDQTGLIVKLSSDGQVIERFALTTPSSGPPPTPGDIVAGPDGALWFTQEYSSIGRITTDGKLSSFKLSSDFSFLTSITAGPDGNLWVTGGSGFDDAIWRVTPSGSITRFPLPDEVFLVQALVPGPDGNLWFTADMSIGKITPNGQITTYKLPGFRPPLTDFITDEYVPADLTVGPDGNLWFIRQNNDFIPSRLGRITTSGVIDEFALPASGSYPSAIVSGPDGNLYIAARGIRQLIKVNPNALTGALPSPSPTASPRPLTPTPSPATVPTTTPRPSPPPTATAPPPPIPGMPPTGGGGAASPELSRPLIALMVLLLLIACRWLPRQSTKS